jgi:preprotein translocase subunit YajC
MRKAAAQQPQGGRSVLAPDDGGYFGVYVLHDHPTPTQAAKRACRYGRIALKKGDEVALSSGMLGKISGLDDNYLVLSVGNNVELKFQKIHVTSVLPKGTLKSVGVESA